MLKNKAKTIKRTVFYLGALIVLILGLIFVLKDSSLAQWEEPTATPPGGNVPAPLNVGSDGQYKEGYLRVGDTTLPSGTYAIEGIAPLGGSGVYGEDGAGNSGRLGDSSGYGVYGYGSTYGVWGQASEGQGVYGQSKTNYGIHGLTTEGLAAVYGENERGRYGVMGTSSIPPVGPGSSLVQIGAGVYGESTASNVFGVWGHGGGIGVYGDSGTYAGVYGGSQASYGVFGSSQASYGVYGMNAASGNYGYLGKQEHALYGYVTGDDALSGAKAEYNYRGVKLYGELAKQGHDREEFYGVYGEVESVAGTKYGVYGKSKEYGVYGEGMYGVKGKGSYLGVSGYNSNTSYASSGALAYERYGVWGLSNISSSGVGVYGKGKSIGVHGEDSDTGSYGYLGSGNQGVYGQGTTYGVYGYSPDGFIGVYGYGKTYGGAFAAATGNTYGVYGYGNTGVLGIGRVTGVIGQSDYSTGYVGHSQGAFYVSTTDKYAFNAAEGDIKTEDGFLCVNDKENEGICPFSDSGEDGRIYAEFTSIERIDLAELFKTKDENLEPGDVVSLDLENQGYVKKTKDAYDRLIVGVYSEDPGLTLGDYNDKEAKPIALVGRVPVKVTSENGPISAGDQLASSSRPGFAMKADPDKADGTILGIALESFNGEEGKVLMLMK